MVTGEVAFFALSACFSLSGCGKLPMVGVVHGQMSWQMVAVELLRRRTGAAPILSDAQLFAGGSEHEAKLQKKRIDGLYYSACNINSARRRLYQVLWDAQAAATRAVVGALEQVGVKPIIFKGLEIGARYDGGKGMGLREDIDLLVTPDELWDAKKVLYGMGYNHGVYNRETRGWIRIDHVKAARHEATAYELVPLTAAVPIDRNDHEMLEEAKQFKSLFCVHDDAALVFVSFDIHHNILFKFDVAPLRKRAVPSGLGAGLALSPADHLWFAIHRYYYEVAIGGIVSPRVLALIAPMVGDAAVDWDLVVANAIAQRATAPCFYWLTFFQKLSPRAVPDRALHQLRAHHHSSERNWGWQFERLLEIDVQFPNSLPGLICDQERSEHVLDADG